MLSRAAPPSTVNLRGDSASIPKVGSFSLELASISCPLLGFSAIENTGMPQTPSPEPAPDLSTAKLADQLAAIVSATIAANSARAAPVTGRTLYDFGSEVAVMLGRLTPWFLLVGMFLYTVI